MALKTQRTILDDIMATTQGKTYTVFTVTLLVVVLLIVFAISPAYLSITNQISRNNAKMAYLADLDKKEETLRSLTNQEADLADEIDILNTDFKDKRNDEFMLSNMSKMASTYNCDLTSMTFGENKVPTIPDLTLYPEFTAVPTTITVSCDLAGLESFLAHVESFPSTMSIKTISYGVVQNEKYGMTIEAEYYFWNKTI